MFRNDRFQTLIDKINSLIRPPNQSAGVRAHKLIANLLKERGHCCPRSTGIPPHSAICADFHPRPMRDTALTKLN